MGVKDLSKELRSSSKLTTRLSDFNGKIVGVDTSIWLNKAIFSSPEIGTLFHQLPQVSLAHQISIYFDRLLAVFDANSIKPLFVVDGCDSTGSKVPILPGTDSTGSYRVLLLYATQLGCCIVVAICSVHLEVN